MALYVQYGCGTWVPEGWLNFDVSPTVANSKDSIDRPAAGTHAFSG